MGVSLKATSQFLVQIFCVLMTIDKYMKILVFSPHNRYNANDEKKVYKSNFGSMKNAFSRRRKSRFKP
jgi:formaldehyde-activating enzyme involved in methanogenesis